MLNQEIQSFLSDVFACDPCGSYFWNLIDLYKGNLKHYSGPRDESDYYRILAGKWSNEYKRHSKVLLDFYQSLRDSDTQKHLRAFFMIAPLVACSYQEDAVTAGLEPKYTALNCFENVLVNINSFSDKKLKYDLLTRIIDRIDAQARGKKNPEQQSLDDERYSYAYNVARYFRANCEYAKQNKDPKVQETLLNDLYYIMRFTNPSNVKLQYGHRIRANLLNKLENAIQTSNNPEKDIRNICATAYEYIAGVGASNQDFMDKVWDEFDHRAITNIPVIVSNIIKKTK